MEGANARELVFVSGDQMGGFDLNFIVGVYEKAGDWAPNRGAHTHLFDEILLFFGHNVNDLSYLGADISIEIGPERGKHNFKEPTVVCIPRGLAHYPVVCNKVEKPYRMMRVGLEAEYKATEVQ